MKVLSPRVLLLTVCAATMLSACGSSSSPTNDELMEDPTGESTGTGTDTGADTGADTGTETGGGTGAEPGTDTDVETGGDTSTEPGSDTGTETGGDTGAEPGADTGTETGGDTGAEPGGDTGTETGGDTGAEPGGDTGTETGGDTGAEPGGDTGTETGGDTGAEPGGDTGTETGGDTGAEPGGDTGSEPGAGSNIFVPTVTAGSDLDRLLKGIKRQVSLTLLDLKKSMNEGIPLTEQQETCLGSFDPAIGEELLAIACEKELATGEIIVYVKQAAFYDTEACHASIFNGDTDNCQLQSAAIMLPNLWNYLPSGRRGNLVFAGTTVAYAQTGTLLELENITPALAGPFSCDFDLQTGSGSHSPPAEEGGSSCASLIAATADNLDEVVPQ